MPPRQGSISRRGLMFALSSPSGAGKTTLSRKLLESEEKLNLSISVTTRKPRPGEIEGQDYYFIKKADFRKKIEANDFLEHAEVFEHLYGTPRAPVEAALGQGEDILFDIDWQGTQQLKETMRDDIVSVFILPPSGGTLHQRLKTRAQDSDAIIKKRMAKASSEISHWAEYDYVIINEQLEESLSELQAILYAERLKRERRTGLSRFVRTIQSELEDL